MLIVKAGYLKRSLLANGFYGSSSIETFSPEIIGLRKGDTAEIIGEFGWDKRIKIHKNNKIINLTKKEISILFKNKEV